MKSLTRRLCVTLLIASIGIVAAGCGMAPASTSDVNQTTLVLAPSAATAPSAIPQRSATTTAAIDQAQAALISFFAALHGGRYTEAVELYGGSYKVLTGYNPMVAPDDHPTLLQNACTANGFQCRKIRTIVAAKEVSPTEFAFVVEFQNEDGSLVTRGPCCGASETEQPTEAQWTYTVKKVGDRFLVQELPVYVP